MNLTQIKLLLELNRLDFNLTAASEALCIVQSAGTRQLKLLEEELALQVFKRKGKRLIGLTREGEGILVQAKQICLAQNNIEAIAQNFHSPDSGQITLACTHTQAKYFLPQKLVSFKKTHPHVKVHIEQGTPKQLVEWLLQGHVDLAISTEALDDCDSLALHTCYQWHHGLVTPDDHSLAEGQLTLEAIAQYPVLTYMPGMTGHGKILKSFADRGLEIEVDLFATDSDVIKNYVRLGFGVGIIAEMAFDPRVDHHLRLQSLAPWLDVNTTKVGYLKQR
ncbi:MAG: LysR substrate-binding domain-containing protein, partial [Hydrogenovibrio sp.]|uniref:LysR substrate-binding domain-containing protein n=1 Tax=Hydrogenovibrio sp. TaxID=2065821 RepID=UPI00286FDE9E